MVVNPGLVIASNKAIIQAQRAIQLASLFTTDFSAELKGENESVSVDVYSGNASTFIPSTNDYENTDGKIIPVKVSLTDVIKATFKISQKDLNQIDKSSKYRNCGVAAGRMISDALEPSARIEGVPMAAASRTTMGALSYREGNRNSVADAYRASRVFVSVICPTRRASFSRPWSKSWQRTGSGYGASMKDPMPGSGKRKAWSASRAF